MQEDIVTGLKRSKRGATVEFNHEEILWINRDALCERELQEEQTVDLSELKQWLLPRQYPEALNDAVALLAIRARSSGEIRTKLLRKPYMEDTIDMVLYKLEKEHFLDDDAFARDWAAQCSCRQMGKHRIYQELLKKGIDRETAQQVLEELEPEESRSAAAALAAKLLKRYAREEDPRKAMNKLLAAMARRGYGFEESKEAIGEAIRRAEREDED